MIFALKCLQSFYCISCFASVVHHTNFQVIVPFLTSWSIFAMLCIVTQFPPALPVGLFHPLMAVLLFFLRAVAKLAGLKRHWHHKGIQHEPQQGSVFNMWSDIYISKEADEKKKPQQHFYNI